MKVKALESFAGVVSMGRGQIKEIEDKAVCEDLIQAGYVEEVIENKIQLTKEEKEALKKAEKEAKKAAEEEAKRLAEEEAKQTELEKQNLNKTNEE